MFSKRYFSDLCVQRAVSSAREEGTKMPENSGVFKRSLSLGGGFPLSQAEVRNLKNTVWNPLASFPEDFGLPNPFRITQEVKCKFSSLYLVKEFRRFQAKSA